MPLVPGQECQRGALVSHIFPNKDPYLHEGGKPQILITYSTKVWNWVCKVCVCVLTYIHKCIHTCIPETCFYGSKTPPWISTITSCETKDRLLQES